MKAMKWLSYAVITVLVFLAVLLHSGVYTTKGTQTGETIIVNRFTGKAWVVSTDNGWAAPGDPCRPVMIPVKDYKPH